MVTLAKAAGVSGRDPTLANVNDVARLLSSYCGRFVIEMAGKDDFTQEKWIKKNTAVLARILLGFEDIQGVPGWNEVGGIDAFVRREIAMEETRPIPTMEVAIIEMLTQYLQVAALAEDPRVLPEQWQAGIRDVISRWALFFIGVPDRPEDPETGGEFGRQQEAFCATGKGGKVDNSCSSRKGKSGNVASEPAKQSGTQKWVADVQAAADAIPWNDVQGGKGYPKINSWNTTSEDFDEMPFEISDGKMFTIYSEHSNKGGLLASTFDFGDAVGSTHITKAVGAKGALEVFKKVSAAALALIKKRRSNVLEFSAAEDNRVKLYERLARTLAGQSGGEYKVFKQQHPHGGVTFNVVQSDVVGDWEIGRKGYFSPVKEAEQAETQAEWEELQPEADPAWFSPEAWEEGQDDESDSPMQEAFCPTGKGGKRKNNCSPKNKGKGKPKPPKKGRQAGAKGGNVATAAGGPAEGSGEAGKPSTLVDWDPKWAESVTPEDFIKARNNSSRAGFLSPLDPGDIANHDLILSGDGTVGAAVSPDGDIQNVFNNGGPKGAGADAMLEAMRRGGKMLDCYDGFLPSFYARFGFKETNRMRFNREYALPTWDYEKLGEPDVVFMALQEEYPVKKLKERLKDNGITAEKSTEYTDDWDGAKARSASVGKRRKFLEGMDRSASEPSQLDRAAKGNGSRASASYRGDLAEAFCATGKGGKIDNSCSPKNKGIKKARHEELEKLSQEFDFADPNEGVSQELLNQLAEEFLQEQWEKQWRHLQKAGDARARNIKIVNDAFGDPEKRIDDFIQRNFAANPEALAVAKKWRDIQKRSGLQVRPSMAMLEIADAAENEGHNTEAAYDDHAVELKKENKALDDWYEAKRPEIQAKFWKDNAEAAKEQARRQAEHSAPTTKLKNKWYKGGGSELGNLVFDTEAGNSFKINVQEQDSTPIGGEVPGGMRGQFLVFSDQDGDYSITGKSGAKEALEVFKKVSAATISWMKETKPDFVHFTAAEANRAKLYERLTRTATSMNDDYVAYSIKPKGSSAYKGNFFVVKKEREQEVLEAMAATGKLDIPGGSSSELTKYKAEKINVEESEGGKAEKYTLEKIEPDVDEAWFTEEGWQDDGEGKGEDKPAESGNVATEKAEDEPKSRSQESVQGGNVATCGGLKPKKFEGYP